LQNFDFFNCKIVHFLNLFYVAQHTIPRKRHFVVAINNFRLGVAVELSSSSSSSSSSSMYGSPWEHSPHGKVRPPYVGPPPWIPSCWERRTFTLLSICSFLRSAKIESNDT
jgi:hypothetical protein